MKVKPHFTFDRGWWYCWVGKYGWPGETPKEAWKLWRANRFKT